MASLPVSVPLSVEQLLEAVEQLSPAEQREFQRRLAARPGLNGIQELDEATLVRAARAGLSAATEHRLRELIAKSQRGQLTLKELAAYQTLAQEAQRIDAAKAEALAELARRRGQSVRAVKAQIDRRGRSDGA